MTEVEWLACRTSRKLMDFLQGQLTERKLRFIGCGCFRLHWARINLSECRGALEIAERMADGIASEDEIAEGFRLANYARDMATGTARNIPRRYKKREVWCGSWAVYDLVGVIDPVFSLSERLHEVHQCVGNALSHLLDIQFRPSTERLAQTRVIRDIVGNPFRSLGFDPVWHTSTAMLLAQGMYESRDFSAMPILADALQDAGCDNADILNHCRDAKAKHVRGCWVVDLVLGKA